MEHNTLNRSAVNHLYSPTCLSSFTSVYRRSVGRCTQLDTSSSSPAWRHFREHWKVGPPPSPWRRSLTGETPCQLLAVMHQDIFCQMPRKSIRTSGKKWPFYLSQEFVRFPVSSAPFVCLFIFLTVSLKDVLVNGRSPCMSPLQYKCPFWDAFIYLFVTVQQYTTKHISTTISNLLLADGVLICKDGRVYSCVICIISWKKLKFSNMYKCIKVTCIKKMSWEDEQGSLSRSR